MNFYQLPHNLPQEIDDLERCVSDFRKGGMHPTQFRGIRVPFGVYEQRAEDTYMMRIRCTGGGATPKQLAKVAELAKRYGSGRIHITTRQEMQIHDVALEHIVAVMRELLPVGLSTRGGGGNTIRNIIASHDSGVNAYESFDVEPYAVALSSLLIAEGDSWNLPRKFKISFSSLSTDSANATVQDLGFIARVQDGQPGFTVFAAGGMGAKSAVGHQLCEFAPANQVGCIAKAVKSLFYKYGNRKNKHRNRLRFLWEDLGEARFRELFEQELQEWRQDASLTLELQAIVNSAPDSIDLVPLHVDNLAYAQWRQRYVTPQRQAGLVSVNVPLFLGDIRADDALKLATFLSPFGENVLRFSMDQNLALRNIPEAYTGNVFEVLSHLRTLADQPAIFSNIMACTGANTCKLGICLPRGLTPAIQRKLSEAGLNLEMWGDFTIHISGCPNSCGQHWTGDLGLFGKVHRQKGRAFPAYEIVAGARIQPEHPRLGIPLSWAPAYDIPCVIQDILRTFLAHKDRWTSFAEYVDNDGQTEIAEICEKYQQVPNFHNDKNYYFDWGAEEIFSTAGMGRGECSAGLFDLIDVDQKTIEKNRAIAMTSENEEHVVAALYKVVFSASRMLLVTKGIETRNNAEVFEQFRDQFIRTGLIEAHFTDLIDLTQTQAHSELRERASECFSLADAVNALYDSMDNSLTFPAGQKQSEAGETASRSDANDLKTPEDSASTKPSVNTFKDYRGVACPMNFVKTKIDLAAMQPGQVLEIYLDDGAPIDNVPRSVKEEGHVIVATRQIEHYWSVIIQKV